jgi:hypothetical protein
MSSTHQEPRVTLSRELAAITALIGGLVGCGELDPVELSGEGSADELALGSAHQELGKEPEGGPSTSLSFVPLHLTSGELMAGAPNLTVTNATTINTSALTIGGFGNAYFVQRGNHAVLFTNAFTVQGAITVTGTRPLIIVAEGHVLIAANINLSANKHLAGPGAQTTGAGAGGVGGEFLGMWDWQCGGGGGGGYGTSGAMGGSSDWSNYPPGAAGAAYGSSPADPLVGGSRGGAGGRGGGGGGGGGALQITSGVAISVGAATISAAGGGGAGGGVGAVGGGGGGSGGEILLEAPSISIVGALAANGGGGGGGGGAGGHSAPPGLDGANGGSGTTPAAGGAEGVPQGSIGGSGAAGLAGSFASAGAGGGYNSKGGGGGGGAGKIWLRYRGATPPNLGSATISPPAGFDATLP